MRVALLLFVMLFLAVSWTAVADEEWARERDSHELSERLLTDFVLSEL